MQAGEKIYYALVRSQMLLSESDDRFFEQYRLGKTRYYALLHIEQNPSISLSVLSKLLLCTKGNTTRIVKGLEQDGYIARQANPKDNRAQCLLLNEAGLKLLKDATHAYQAYKQSLFACLDEEQADFFVETLETLNTHCLARLRPR
jgi:DNA-binding MarR family transcriptional regulator